MHLHDLQLAISGTAIPDTRSDTVNDVQSATPMAGRVRPTLLPDDPECGGGLIDAGKPCGGSPAGDSRIVAKE